MNNIFMSYNLKRNTKMHGTNIPAHECGKVGVANQYYLMSIGPSRCTEKGGESVLDNFNVNLLQSTMAHLTSAKQ